MTYKEFRQRYQYNEAEHSLGEGAFGNVYRAIDTESGETVAIKIAKQIQIQDEAKLIKDKKDYSPYIVNYKESGTFSDIKKDYIVMQFYKDGDLSNRQSELSFPEKEFVLEKILEGIKYLHQNNIIHRDLKPNNILISIENGKYIPKISDFGLSKNVSNREDIMRNSIESGTLGYASPEQMNSDVIDFNSDLWSFGVIAFEVLSGHFPFLYDDLNLKSESDRNIFIQRICKAEYQELYLADTPECWQKLIRRCLTPDFNGRIKTADDCLKVLVGKEEKIELEEPELVDEVNDNQNNDNVDSKDKIENDTKGKLKLWMIISCVIILLSSLTLVWVFNDSTPKIEANIIASGTTGECKWTLTEDSILIISGNGSMADYESMETNYKGEMSPWMNYERLIVNIVIEQGVTSIGNNAFHYLRRTRQITIPNSIKTIGDGAFWICGSLTSIDIPNSVTSIGRWAFSNCGLTTVDIPANVTSIGSGAFHGLTAINVAKENKAYASEEGVLFNKARDTLIQYPSAKQATEYRVPNSVISIGEEAFSYCKALTEIEIRSVKNISNWAFCGSEALTNINGNNYILSDYIGKNAFAYCKALKSIHIYRSSTVGDYAFNGCDSLEYVMLDRIKNLGCYAFYFCKALKRIDVYSIFSEADETTLLLEADETTFNEINKECELIVEDCKDIVIYKKAVGWKNIKYINCLQNISNRKTFFRQ
ncbi:MAG: leucine-rich repeat protein [Candidatus Azobacteroides sp.]|nr:leucine-rich repeat protein [Candidatus Azobacteroides sp.]